MNNTHCRACGNDFENDYSLVPNPKCLCGSRATFKLRQQTKELKKTRVEKKSFPFSKELREKIEKFRQRRRGV